MKKVKRSVPEALLRAQIDDLTLEEIATSSEYSRLIEATANALLRSHNRSRKIIVRVIYDPLNPVTAFTDDYSVNINMGNHMFIRKPNSEESVTVKESCERGFGGEFHEVGHVLYTCFSELRRMGETFERGDLDVPENLDEELQNSYDEMKEVMKNDKAVVLRGFQATPVRQFLFEMYAALSNCIEDGRIEKLLLRNDYRFSGLAEGLKKLRNYHKEEGKSWDLSQQDIPTFFNLCLMYAKYDTEGIENYTGGYDAFEKAMPLIDEMVGTLETRRFAQLNQAVLLCLWPKIKELIIEADSGDDGSESGENGEGNESNNESSGNGSSENSSADGSSKGGSGSDENPEEQQNKSSSGSEKNSSDSEEQKNENSSGSAEQQNESSEKSLEKTMKEILEEIRKTVPEEQSFQNDEGETSQKQNEEQNSEQGETDDSNLNATINSVMRSIADTKARDAAAQEAGEEAKKNIAAIGRGYAQYNGTKIINMKPAYYSEDLDKATESAIKKAAREIRRHLETDQRTGTSKRKYSGKKFHADKLVNRDFRYFENKATRRDMPKVKVGLVIDESGSMSSDNRWRNARNAAITLYKIFEYIPNLDIAIYGHSTRHEVEIYNYASFGIKQNNMIERLSNISARGGNIDVVPVTIMAENLLAEDADSRILFIITDGLPYSFVSGMTPEQELTETANKYTRKGIDIIVASIGDDESRLRTIYKNQRFLNITSASELPKKVVDVIKRKL